MAMDFQGPDVIDEDVQEQLKTKQKYLGAAIERVIISFRGLFYLRRRQAEDSDNDDEKIVRSTHRLSDPPSPSLGLHDNRISVATTVVQHTIEGAETKSEPAAPLRRRLARLGSSFLQTLIMPCSVSIILAFIISIIPVLKALFVPDVPGVNMPPAPDGQPPLAVILNTTTFIGGASVPLGLMTLGSALARMEIPGGDLRSLPLGAIGALAIGRLAIMPVLGVLIIRGLTQVGLLDANDNVLRFVCMYVIFLSSSLRAFQSTSSCSFMSCLPTGTTQVGDPVVITSPCHDVQRLGLLLGFLDPSLFWDGQRATSLGVPHSTVYSHDLHDDCIDGVHAASTLRLEVSHYSRPSPVPRKIPAVSLEKAVFFIE